MNINTMVDLGFFEQGLHRGGRRSEEQGRLRVWYSAKGVTEFAAEQRCCMLITSRDSESWHCFQRVCLSVRVCQQTSK